MARGVRNGVVMTAGALLAAAAWSGIGEAQGQGLEVLQVRPNFYMIAGAGANVGVQVGDDGVVVVDSGAAANADAVLAAITRISPAAIRYVIDPSADGDHVGGNETICQAGDPPFTG